MTHRWLTRALVAVAVPALVAPTVASTATAVPKPPAVPTLAAVAKIYPHLEGGSIDVSRVSKIRMPEKSCKRGSVIKGATGQEAMYAPDIESMEDVKEFEVTGQEPMVSVTTQVFRSARVASQYLRATLTEGQDCEELVGDEGQMKKIRFKLGSERWGFQVRTAIKKDPLIGNVLFFRTGAKIVGVMSMSMTGKTAPSIPKTIAVARLALKTVG
ncbi:hypothetical protein GCM10023350_20200 [Nocardioides endophyticus]|uniref:Sensor domain-containing protein n=1 Tax=Nocardioides endophyticus TaxID=1353775 RepID=A0ABP8YSG8_9ACTN